MLLFIAGTGMLCAFAWGVLSLRGSWVSLAGARRHRACRLEYRWTWAPFPDSVGSGMWRRLGLPVVVGLAVTAGLAAADSGSRPAPVAQSSARAAVHLPKVSHCIRRNVRLTVLPPAGTSFTSLSVRVGDDEIMQLSGLSARAR